MYQSCNSFVDKGNAKPFGKVATFTKNCRDEITQAYPHASVEAGGSAYVDLLMTKKMFLGHMYHQGD